MPIEGTAKRILPSVRPHLFALEEQQSKGKDIRFRVEHKCRTRVGLNSVAKEVWEEGKSRVGRAECEDIWAHVRRYIVPRGDGKKRTA
jgi:hypothetical protein